MTRLRCCAQIESSRAVDSHGAPQQHVSGVGGNDFHGGDLVHRHCGTSSGSCVGTVDCRPGGQTILAAIAADDHHGQLAGFVLVVAGGARFRRVGAIHVDFCAQPYPVSLTVAVSSVVATGVIVTADAAAWVGTEVGAPQWNCTPTRVIDTITAAAAATGTQVAKRVLRRPRLTVAGWDVKADGLSRRGAFDERSSIAATSSRVSCPRRSGIPLS